MDNMENDVLGAPYDDGIWNLPIPVFCIDIVIFTYYNGKLHVVLKQNESDGIARFILPGGIMKSGFTLDENFYAILHKQTGINKLFKQQIHVSGDPGHDPRGHSVSLSFLSLIEQDELLKNADLTKIRLVEYDALDKIEIGHSFEHKKIIDHARYHLVKRMEYSGIAKCLLTENFTFNALHQIYENILSASIDIRNFKKKMLYTKIIRETGFTDKTNSKKPAMLYSFN